MGFTVANWVYLAMPRLINKITTITLIFSLFVLTNNNILNDNT
jgi:hypothetical protein